MSEFGKNPPLESEIEFNIEQRLLEDEKTQFTALEEAEWFKKGRSRIKQIAKGFMLLSLLAFGGCSKEELTQREQFQKSGKGISTQSYVDAEKTQEQEDERNFNNAVKKINQEIDEKIEPVKKEILTFLEDFSQNKIDLPKCTSSDDLARKIIMMAIETAKPKYYINMDEIDQEHIANVRIPEYHKGGVYYKRTFFQNPVEYYNEFPDENVLGQALVRYEAKLYMKEVYKYTVGEMKKNKKFIRSYEKEYGVNI